MKYVLNTEYQNPGLPCLIKSHNAGTRKMLSDKLNYGKANNMFNITLGHLKNMR